MVCARMLNILNLIDDARCFETIRPSNALAPRGDLPPLRLSPSHETGAQRYPSRNDKSMSVPYYESGWTDLTGTIFAGHHQPLRVWMLCLYFMGLNLSNEQITQELDLNSDDAQKMTTQLREGIVERKPEVTLSGEVMECDEVYVVAGHKGKPERDQKKRGGPGTTSGLKGERGRGTLEKEKPPIFGMMQRSGEVVITMLPNVQQKTIAPLIEQTIAKGTVVYTDEYDIYDRLTEWGYPHHTLSHSAGERRPQRGWGWISEKCMSTQLRTFGRCC